MEQLLALIADYGFAVYVILFLYCAFKSGILPLVAGWAAQSGVLDLWAVVLATFLGGTLGDELRFLVARRFGPSLRTRSPKFAAVLDKAGALFNRYGAAYIFLYRYPKGLRTVGALPVGLSSMAWGRFTLLNGLSTGVWSGLLVGAGYAFGAAIARFATQSWGPISLALLAAMTVAVFYLWRRAYRIPAVAGDARQNSIGLAEALPRSTGAKP